MDEEGITQWESGQFSKKTTIPNVYAPNNRTSNTWESTTWKVVQLQGEVDEATLTVEDFNIPL